MPLYEYYCAKCDDKFTALRSISQANAPIECPSCHAAETKRALSLFASFSKSSSGETRAVGGGSSCASCSSHNCSSCDH